MIGDEADRKDGRADEREGRRMSGQWPQFKFYHVQASALRLHEVAALREEYMQIAEYSNAS